MTTSPSTVDDAEAAWLTALSSPDRELLAALVHSDFIAVHGPTGQIQERDSFLTDSAKRPPAQRIEILESTVRYFGDTATVSCIQEMRVPFVPDAPGFAIQAAVTRVWVRSEDGWQLAHLQMARRIPPG